ncbi:MAG: DinB family protein [Xanthomonadales bacterium]|nr:DinB family protein [Xanthomonadales bacterium]
MTISNHFRLLSRYNQWMNGKVYAAALQMGVPALREDRGAFFGSVFGTLNHIMVADTIWLKRFAAHPRAFRSLQAMRSMPGPDSLRQTLHDDMPALQAARHSMDAVIIAFAEELTDEDCASTLSYATMAGQAFENELGLLVGHFFNHQTHHRGQVTTLLSQAGIDVGVTDLVAMAREEGRS